MRKLFFLSTMAIFALNSSYLTAARGGGGHGGGGHEGGGNFHGNGGGEFHDGGRNFDHDNFNHDNFYRHDVEGGFVSPYNDAEYYYDDPDLPDAITPPEDYYEDGSESIDNPENSDSPVFNEFPG